MIINFDIGLTKSKVEILNLGPVRILNIKFLSFDDDTLEGLDDVLLKAIAYGKGRKCREIWIPADKATVADDRLKEKGFKHGFFKAHIPGNSPEGWRLTL